MSSFEPNKRHFEELLIYFFNLMKSVAEAHRHAALSERSCREWFQKFENGVTQKAISHRLKSLGIIQKQVEL